MHTNTHTRACTAIAYAFASGIRLRPTSLVDMHEDTRPEILARLEPLSEVGTTSRTRVPPPSKPHQRPYFRPPRIPSIPFFSSFLSFAMFITIRRRDGKGTDPSNVRDFETFRELDLVALETCFGNPVASHRVVVCVLDWSFVQDSGDVEEGGASRGGRSGQRKILRANVSGEKMG